MTPVRAIGTVAHLPLYVGLGLLVCPACPAAYVLLGCLAMCAAYMWPVLDYFIVIAAAVVSLTAAVAITIAAIAAAWLATRVVEAM